MSFRIRILSDLHIGHKSSLLKEAGAIKPLAEDVDLLILNGDTVESKYADSEARRKQELPSFRDVDEEIRSWGIKTLYLTGNHDPDIGGHHYLQIAGSEILITHGDGIFENIAPWSRNAKALKETVQMLLANRRVQDFQSYLQAIKDAETEAHRKSPEYDPTVWGKFNMFVKQAWPPNHIFGILKCWKQTPRKAADMVKRFNVKPEFLIIGHTHKPGIWNVSGTWIINTGSFFIWPGAYCVDITPEGIVCQKISKLGRSLELAGEIRRFPLSESTIEDCAKLASGNSQSNTEKPRPLEQQITPSR